MGRLGSYPQPVGLSSVPFPFQAVRVARDHPVRLVALGAHPDDLEIACGGTLLRLLAVLPVSSVRWIVLAGTPERAAEARAAATEMVAGARDCVVVVHGFQDGFLPAHWDSVKRTLQTTAATAPTDLVFCPSRQDAHQDHRLVAELAWQVFRGATILEYEVPKWDGDLGQPSLYVPLDEDTVARKIALLHRCFPSQAGKPWFDDEVFRGLLRLRGMECGARYAEAFYAHKLVLLM